MKKKNAEKVKTKHIFLNRNQLYRTGGDWLLNRSCSAISVCVCGGGERVKRYVKDEEEVKCDFKVLKVSGLQLVPSLKIKMKRETKHHQNICIYYSIVIV